MKEARMSLQPGASQLLDKINSLLLRDGRRSYLVGGYVRDMLLERHTADIDIAVTGDALEAARRVAEALNGRYICLDAVNGTGRVILFQNKTRIEGNWQIDLTTIKDNIEDDLFRRDFTIDAMAFDLQELNPDGTLPMQRLIDPFSGRRDLDDRLIRAVAETTFAADAVRLIRAVRLAAELDFRIENDTSRLIAADAHLLRNVAGERVREELLRVLATGQAGPWLEYLDESGLLTAIIPELEPARGVSQPKIHVWDIHRHSLRTVAALEFLLREGAWDYADASILASVPWSDSLSRHFDSEISHGSTRRSLLKLTALLHDIAKPQTRSLDVDGRARFLGHPEAGAATAAGILTRLRFSTREIKLVELMIKYHLRPTQMSQGELPSRRAIYRYFRDTGEAGIDILFLNLADHLATRGRELDRAGWDEHVDTAAYVLERHLEETELTTPSRIINGHDIIKTFGLTPGPRIGELLEALREAQASGAITERQQAIEYIRSLLQSRRVFYDNELSQGEA